MDDLFNFGAPVSGSASEASSAASAQPGSRRAARESSGDMVPARGASKAPKISKRDLKAQARSAASRRDLARPTSDRKAVSRATRVIDAAHPTGRKLRRSEIRLINKSAPKPPRKNPLSVLMTMAIVGGLFAVAGLPAYALVAPEIAASKTDAAAQSLIVSADAAPLDAVRDGFHATTPEQLAQQNKEALRAAANAEYLASGAREMGDDYPWPYELTDDQGGGLSPLNYYYRECVDFVAWRLNRDAGYYAAPFKWVWSNLTPNGGNGGQWMYNWEQHGWPVSKTPIVGSVAYTGGNHVAYVKAVNADGTVTLEEYNYVPGKYSQRTVPASSMVAFLYPPPA